MSETRQAITNLYGQQEIEKFYRFIYENGLQKEAYTALKMIHRRLNSKKGKSSRE